MNVQRKSVTLIIIIFLLLILAVLSTSLVMMQSGDFELNVRNWESEQALYLAESGVEWALKELSVNAAWRTDGAPMTIYLIAWDMVNMTLFAVLQAKEIVPQQMPTPLLCPQVMSPLKIITGQSVQ